MILNIYKETDWTSFDVVAKLRGVLKIKKIGHAGTLDPLAEGVLVILTEKDTKRQEEMMGMEKEYLAEIAFGAESPTYDLEGSLVFSEKDKFIDERDLENALEKYIGEFEQKVPAYSAVKVKGERLYKKAREGTINPDQIPTKTVSTKLVTLESLEVRNVQDKNLSVATIKIICSKGFYVRSLAHDLGQDLGTGAVLTKLIRTRVGDFKLEGARKISEIKPIT